MLLGVHNRPGPDKRRPAGWTPPAQRGGTARPGPAPQTGSGTPRRRLNDAERRELHGAVQAVSLGRLQDFEAGVEEILSWGVPRAVDALGALCGAYLHVLTQSMMLGRGAEEDLELLTELCRALPEVTRPDVTVLAISALAALEYNTRGAMGTMGPPVHMVTGLVVLLAALGGARLGTGEPLPALSWAMSMVEPVL